jgi:peptidoglycan/LPS O-acetylase OafA/YrhL
VSTTGPEKRLAGLDGLRATACLLVFLYHLRWHARPGADTPLSLQIGAWNLEPILTRADIGVGIFFVLSGLLLSLPYWRTILNGREWPDYGAFVWRRACRIVPAYYAVLAVVYLLRSGTYTFHGGVDLLLHAAFMHNFADYSYLSVLGPLWTIGIEFQFYLLLPLIMRGVAWLCRKGGGVFALVALIAATWALDVAVSSALTTLAPAIPDRILADSDSLVAGGTVFSCLKLFAFGIAAAFAVIRWRWSPGAADGLVVASLSGLIALMCVGSEGGWRMNGPTGWPLNALVLAMLAASLACSGLCARIFSARWLVFAGTISYGIYLWHELVLRAVFGGTLRHSLGGWSLFLAGGAISLAVTTLIATLSWRWIERDALRLPCPISR